MDTLEYCYRASPHEVAARIDSLEREGQELQRLVNGLFGGPGKRFQVVMTIDRSQLASIKLQERDALDAAARKAEAYARRAVVDMLGERRRLYRLIDRMKFGGTFRHDFNFSEDAT